MGRPESNTCNEITVEGEDRFGHLLDAAPDAMIIVDRTGRMLLLNLQAESMFGYPREALLGQPVEMLIPKIYSLNTHSIAPNAMLHRVRALWAAA
jgi:PAS domain S-box-containing protein